MNIAVIEFGGSHDECQLGQVLGLKHAGAKVFWCTNQKIVDRNPYLRSLVDEIKIVEFQHKAIPDLKTVFSINKWFKQKNIQKVVFNTAQGGNVRNLCLLPNKNIEFYGIVHTIRLLRSSATQNIISKKIKHYFLLNDTLKEKLGPKEGFIIDTYYPLSFPPFEAKPIKPKGEIWLTVIGGIEFRKRDLTGFLNFAEKAPKTCKFIFLGKSDLNLADVAYFNEEIKQRGLTEKITTFTDFVDQKTFNDYIASTDFILPLIHPEAPCAKEYFEVLISGAINTAFGYHIPMMIHEGYKHWEDFHHGVQFYNLTDWNEQLKLAIEQRDELVQQMKNNPKLQADYQNQRFAKIIMG